MSQRNRATVGYLLRQLNGLRNQINETIESVDPTPPDHSFTCKGCGHSDWEHTNFAGGCIATKPCSCTGMDTISDCDHHGVDGGGTDYYGTSNPPQEWDWNYAYCPKCGAEL